MLVATRVHQGNATRPVDVGRLRAFVEQALGWGPDFSVAVAVGSEGDLGRALLANVEAMAATVRADTRFTGRRVEVRGTPPVSHHLFNALVFSTTATTALPPLDHHLSLSD